MPHLCGVKESIPDGDGIQFPIIYTDADLPCLLSDKYNLGGIGTVRGSNDPLAKPGVKAFAHLSLKLPRDCPMREVYRLVGASRNSVGQFITVTQVLIM